MIAVCLLACIVFLCWLCCLNLWCCYVWFFSFAVFSSLLIKKSICYCDTNTGIHVFFRKWMAGRKAHRLLYFLYFLSIVLLCIDWYCMMVTDAAWLKLTGRSALLTMWLSAPVLAYIHDDFWHWGMRCPNCFRVGLNWVIVGELRVMSYIQLYVTHYELRIVV